MKLVPLTTIVLLSAGISAQPASAGPFDALKNFFVRPQPQHHVVHPHPVHREGKEAKEQKEAPADSPATTVPPGEQQTNNAPVQNSPNTPSTLNVTNRPGRPTVIASAPLF